MPHSRPVSVHEVEVIAPNFKRRLSGVTSTIIQLVPLQRALGLKIASIGPGLPAALPHLGWSALFGLWRPPPEQGFRIWHARRNSEMLAGVVLRDLLRMKLQLVFTSAAQRQHRAFTKWLLARMDRVIATSVRSGSFLTVPHQVIMHGIDCQRFQPPATLADQFSAAGLPGQYAIGCFGRLRHSKGTDLFVDAMIALLPKYPHWTAIITGRTTARHRAFTDDLCQRIAAAGLSQRIHLLGEVPDVRIWYRRLALYVAPSRNEGFGLTPLEAMACQTAVVASDAGAYAEMIVAGTGSVVPAGDLAALCGAIEPYLASPELALRHGENALRHVRQAFSLDKEATAINALYARMFAA